MTGYNEAFIIDEQTRNELVEASPKSAEIIRPILRGRDIKKYISNWADLYLINTHTGYKSQNGNIVPPVNIDEYPAVKKHLDKYSTQLIARQDKGITPYNLRSCIYMEDFFRPKIVWGEISDKSKFAYDSDSIYTEATTFLMTGKNLKYLLAMLNSKLLEWYFNQIGTATGVGTNRWKKYTIELLPIIIPNKETVEKIENHINSIIINKNFDESTEHILNDIIFELYELTKEESLFIKNVNI